MDRYKGDDLSVLPEKTCNDTHGYGLHGWNNCAKNWFIISKLSSSHKFKVPTNRARSGFYKSDDVVEPVRDSFANLNWSMSNPKLEPQTSNFLRPNPQTRNLDKNLNQPTNEERVRIAVEHNLNHDRATQASDGNRKSKGDDENPEFTAI